MKYINPSCIWHLIIPEAAWGRVYTLPGILSSTQDMKLKHTAEILLDKRCWLMTLSLWSIDLCVFYTPETIFADVIKNWKMKNDKKSTSLDKGNYWWKFQVNMTSSSVNSDGPKKWTVCANSEATWGEHFNFKMFITKFCPLRQSFTSIEQVSTSGSWVIEKSISKGEMYTTFPPKAARRVNKICEKFSRSLILSEAAGYLILTLLKVTLYHLGSLCSMHVKSNKLVSMYTSHRWKMGGLKKYVQTIQNYCNDIFVPSAVVLHKLLQLMLKHFPTYTNYLINLKWQDAGKTPQEEYHFLWSCMLVNC